VVKAASVNTAVDVARLGPFKKYCPRVPIRYELSAVATNNVKADPFSWPVYD